MRKRPSRHVRRIKTKNGLKKIMINKDVRKRVKKKRYASPGQLMPRAQNVSGRRVSDYDSALLTIDAFSGTPESQLTTAEKENLERSKKVVENFNPNNRFTRDAIIRSVQKEHFRM